MATQFADILFVIVAIAIVVSQAYVLRSTARGIRYSAAHGASQGNSQDTPQAGSPAARPRNATLEWAYAIVPALALVALLAFSWRAMHPTSVHVEGAAPPAGFER